MVSCSVRYGTFMSPSYEAPSTPKVMCIADEVHIRCIFDSLYSTARETCSLPHISGSYRPREALSIAPC